MLPITFNIKSQPLKSLPTRWIETPQGYFEYDTQRLVNHQQYGRKQLNKSADKMSMAIMGCSRRISSLYTKTSSMLCPKSNAPPLTFSLNTLTLQSDVVQILYLMIIPTFTARQIVDEFRKDLANIFYFVDHQKQRLRRAALKAHKFPVAIHGWHTTPMKNKWLYILSARSKKDYDDTSMVTFVMTFRDHQGKTWAMMQSFVNNQTIVLFYTPHLFSRYNNRMNLNLRGDEIIYHYFKNNGFATFGVKTKMINESQYTQDITATTNEGVSLGVMTTEGALLKTFISYDMAKGEQIESFMKSEMIRKEMEEKYMEECYAEYKDMQTAQNGLNNAKR